MTVAWTRVVGGLLLLCAVAAAAVTGAGAAAAHAVLVATDPGYGATVTTAPARVTVTFDEAVTVATGGLTVTDRDGHRVDTGRLGAADSGKTITVTLPSEVPTDTYLVNWVVLSADGHTVSGSSVFGVGVSPDDVSVLAPQRDPLAVAADGVVRMLTAVGYAGVILAVGVPLATRAIAPGAAGTGVVRQVSRVGAIAVAVISVSIVVATPVRLAGPDGWSRAQVWGQALSALPARAEVIRAAAALLLFATALPGLTRSGRTRLGRVRLLPVRTGFTAVDATSVDAASVDAESVDTAPADAIRVGSARRATPAVLDDPLAGTVATVLRIAAGAVLILATATAGHAVADSLPWVAVAITALHLTAMAVWVGGVLSLVLLRRDGDRRAAVTRFSRIALAAVAVLVVTGTYRAWRSVDPFAALWTTTWGRLLLLKCGLVGAALLAAASIRFLARRNSAILRVELGCQAAVLIVTAVLAGVTPARDAYDPSATLTAIVGPLRAEVSVDRSGAGPQEFTVHLRDSTGTPVGATELGAQLSAASGPHPPVDIPFHRVDPVELGPNYFVSQHVRVSARGMWRLRLTIRTDATTAYTASVPYRVW